MESDSFITFSAVWWSLLVIAILCMIVLFVGYKLVQTTVEIVDAFKTLYLESSTPKEVHPSEKLSGINKTGDNDGH